MSSGPFIFHLVALAAALGVWLTCTTKSGNHFEPFDLGDLELSSESTYALPLQVNLLILAKEPTELPQGIWSSVKSVASAWSWLIDLEMHAQQGVYSNLCCVNCEEKLDLYSLYTDIPRASPARQLDIIVILSNQDCGTIPHQSVHYVRDPLEILSVVISTLRDHHGLVSSTEDEYIDGFLPSELCDINPDGCLVRVAKKATIAYIAHEASLFNALMALNKPTVNEHDFAKIESVRAQLKALPDDLVSLQALASVLTDLVSSPSLAAEEYFQWDFKIGVYAPLMLPPLFPIVGALYWSFIERKAYTK